MPINFPDSPTTGDTHTVGDKTWTFDGTAWTLVTGATADHGNLGGLADDDHTQYLLADGTRSATGTITATAFSGPLTGNVTGNADTATKLATARTITLGTDLSGSVSFDGSADVTLNATVADDSHNHVISNVDGLQTALDAKLDSSSYTASDVLTKIKTVDGAGSGLDADTLDGVQGDNYALKTYVDTAVSNLVDAAPATLDTLNELAAALGDDPNFATTVASSIGAKQDAATALTTTTSFGGDVSGTYNAIVVADDSHNHIISNVDGLQTALDAKQAAATALTTTTTFGGDVSGTYNAIVVADDSHNHVISNVDGLQTALDGKLGSTANAVSASKLATARTISLTGDVTGSVSFDGSANASITATVADDSHNHVTSNIDGLEEYIEDVVAGSLTAGSQITVTYDDNANTITIAHADTSTQASVNNSNGTVIQDVTVDGNGHVTALGSVDLDGRYYTETEADARFLRGDTSDTLSGTLTVTGGLTVDTNTLHVDPTNNRVGISDTTPSYTLDVNGDINTTGALRTDGKKTGMVLLTSGDVSNGGPITFTGLFSSEFDNYIVYISDLTCTGQNAIYYRMAQNGSWYTGSVYSTQRIYGQNTSVGAQRFSSNYANLGYSGGRRSLFEIHFASPYLSSPTQVKSMQVYSDNNSAGFIDINHSYVDTSLSYDGFVFDEVTGGASISCRYEVYGIPK